MDEISNKKLLIVGAGIDQLPAIQMAKDLGIFTITTDLDSKAPGAAFADKFYPISTTDFSNTLKIAQQEEIDGIMTLISESAVPVVARIAEEMNLPGISSFSARVATDKTEMHRILGNSGIKMPRSISTSNLNEVESFSKEINFPIIVKPANSSGQRGITYVLNKSQLTDSLLNAQNHSSNDKVVLEEFIEGIEINVCTIIIKGIVHVLSLSNRVTLKSPYFGIAIEHICNTTLPEILQRKVNELAVQATKKMKINNGITYPQIIVRNEEPHLIEIAARIPGGNMREIAFLHSGVDLINVAILQALDIKMTYSSLIKGTQNEGVVVKHITKLNIPHSINQVISFNEIENVKGQSGVYDCFYSLKENDIIPDLTWSGGRFGAIITFGESTKDAYLKAQKAFTSLKINEQNLIDYDQKMIQSYDHIYNLKL